MTATVNNFDPDFPRLWIGGKYQELKEGEKYPYKWNIQVSAKTQK